MLSYNALSKLIPHPKFHKHLVEFRTFPHPPNIYVLPFLHLLRRAFSPV